MAIEFVNAYPSLYTKEEINKLINNEKIVYLPNNPYIVNKTVFLGCCGYGIIIILTSQRQNWEQDILKIG